MLKKTLVLLGFIIIGLYGLAQSVTNIKFKQEGKQIIVNYNIVGAMFYHTFETDLYVSTDGGNTFTGPLQKVSGDVGPNITQGTDKEIVWEVLQEMPGFGGEVVFDVRVKVMEQNLRRKFFLGYKGSLMAPLGATMGLTGKVGFYASARINQGYLTEYTYETDGELVVNYDNDGYYTFTRNEKTQRFSITGGLQFQVYRKAHIYVGAGYALYNLIYEIDMYEYPENKTGTTWAMHNGESLSLVEAEAGVMIEIWHLYISGGVSSPGFQWVEPAVSVGVIF